MDQNDKTKKIIETLEGAEKIAILPGGTVSEDTFSAGVGLYHLLTEKFKSKTISLVYTKEIPDKCKNLVDTEKVIKDVGSKDLVVSIDYSDTPAAKVQYSTDKSILYLKVSPINEDFDKSRVKAEISTSVDYDVIITIGAQSMEDYGKTFKEMETVFYSAKVINLDNTDRNLRFGNYNIVDSSQDTLSLLVLNIASIWGLKISKKAGKALLTGITFRDTSS